MKLNQELLVVGLRIYKLLEISQVLAQAAIYEGLNVKTAEFTNEPLMFIEIAHIRIGEEIYSPLILKNKVDILVCFEPLLALDLAVDYLSPEGTIIINMHSMLPFTNLSDQVLSLYERLTEKIIKLDIIQIAKEADVVHKNNFVMLGALAGLNVIPVELVNIMKAIKEIIHPDDIEICIKALETGKQATLVSKK